MVNVSLASSLTSINGVRPCLKLVAYSKWAIIGGGNAVPFLIG